MHTASILMVFELVQLPLHWLWVYYYVVVVIVGGGG